jgi:hypothetical protein
MLTYKDLKRPTLVDEEDPLEEGADSNQIPVPCPMTVALDPL